MNTVQRKLRFCMITTFYPPYGFGGDAVYVQQLSNELAARGHHVTVIHCIDSYNLLSKNRRVLPCIDHPGVEVHGLKSGYGPLSPLATQQSGLPLFKSGRIREILAGGFDVIHFHNISLAGGPGILGYGEGIKLYTIHEYWLVCPTHVLMKYESAPCVKPSCTLCQIVYKRPPQLWRHTGLLKDSLKHLDAIISPSRFAMKIHEDAGIDVPITHIPHFAPDLYDPAAPGEADEVKIPDKPFFLYAGRIERLKGVQNLVPVFRGYAKADLVIAGEGNYESLLRKAAEGADNIHMPGHLSRACLAGLYKRALALIVPSINYEIAPLVIFEAFRQKTPVIVNNIGGLPEFIEDSGSGIVYSSEAELVRAMDLLLANPSYRDELGRRGYEAYLKKWNPESHLSLYFDLIGRIDARKNGR